MDENEKTEQTENVENEQLETEEQDSTSFQPAVEEAGANNTSEPSSTPAGTERKLTPLEFLIFYYFFLIAYVHFIGNMRFNIRNI